MAVSRDTHLWLWCLIINFWLSLNLQARVSGRLWDVGLGIESFKTCEVVWPYQQMEINSYPVAISVLPCCAGDPSCGPRLQWEFDRTLWRPGVLDQCKPDGGSDPNGYRY